MYPQCYLCHFLSPRRQNSKIWWSTCTCSPFQPLKLLLKTIFFCRRTVSTMDMQFTYMYNVTHHLQKMSCLTMQIYNYNADFNWYVKLLQLPKLQYYTLVRDNELHNNIVSRARYMLRVIHIM